jgi:hypothetical protein
VTGWSLYTLLLWLLKTCMAIFYSRLTWVLIPYLLLCPLLLTYILPSSAGLVNMRVRIHVAYVLIAMTYIATICSILFGCRPMEKNWQIHPNPGSTSYPINNLSTWDRASDYLQDYCQPAVSKIDIYVTVVLNVATDLYLISIPAPVSLPRNICV